MAGPGTILSALVAASTVPPTVIAPSPPAAIAAMALPEERHLVPVFADAIRPGTAEDALARFDDLLARLPRPTRLRGAVQTMRSAALLALRRHAEAEAAIDEALRIDPTSGPTLLQVVRTRAYGPRVAEAGDAMVRAATVAPGLARTIDAAAVESMTTRLQFAKDRARSDALAEALVRIDYGATGIARRSTLAARVVGTRMRGGDEAGARALLSRVADPRDLAAMLSDNRYRALWPDIERIGGPRLEARWAGYLAETRAAWYARAPYSGPDYARALIAAGHLQTLIATFQPVLAGTLDPGRDYEMVLVAPPLARALSASNRFDEADAVLRDLQRTWPPAKTAAGLNLSGNRPGLLRAAGRLEEALAAYDAVLAEAAAHPDVNASALIAYRAGRACTLHRMRHGDAAADAAALDGPKPARIGTLDCLGRRGEARALLLAMLEDEDERGFVLELVQPRTPHLPDTDEARAEEARRASLAADPVLLAAVARYGRVLDFPVEGAVPAGISPEGPPPASPPPPRSARKAPQAPPR